MFALLLLLFSFYDTTDIIFEEIMGKHLIMHMFVIVKWCVDFPIVHV